MLSRTQCSGHGVLCTVVFFFGECQPQCKNRQHKLLQKHLMLSSDYHTHAVKTKKGETAMYKIKSGLRLIAKKAKSKRKGN